MSTRSLIYLFKVRILRAFNAQKNFNFPSICTKKYPNGRNVRKSIKNPFLKYFEDIYCKESNFEFPSSSISYLKNPKIMSMKKNVSLIIIIAIPKELKSGNELTMK